MVIIMKTAINENYRKEIFPVCIQFNGRIWKEKSKIKTKTYQKLFLFFNLKTEKLKRVLENNF